MINLVGLKQKLKEAERAKLLYGKFRTWSIKKALQNQGLTPRYNQLKRLNIDITNQYSKESIESEYIKTKVLALHSFQMALFAQFINYQEESNKWKVVDLGDSSGNHSRYIKKLFDKHKFLTVGVNSDKKAIERIDNNNSIGCYSSIERYTSNYYHNNSEKLILLMFETLEHLDNPIEVLKNIRANMNPVALIITVPFVRRSRVGLHYLRNNLKTDKEVNQENNHIFELSPDDWMLLFKYCGFKVEKAFIYYQYPRWIPFLRYYWQAFDFEGFVGFILNIKEKV